MKCNTCYMDTAKCICSWKKNKHIVLCDITSKDGVPIIICPPYLIEVDGD